MDLLNQVIIQVLRRGLLPGKDFMQIRVQWDALALPKYHIGHESLGNCKVPSKGNYRVPLEGLGAIHCRFSVVAMII